MRVLITGGAGFIGTNLVRELTTWGDEVRVIDDLSTGFRDNLAGLDAHFIEGSILDADLLTKAANGVEAVVHLAARGSVPRSIADPLASHHVNATGTVEVLEAVRRNGGAHVIVASSSSVYGGNPVLPKHEDLATSPLSPYAASKVATESCALAWGVAYHFPVLAFRFFNVFGPFQRAGHPYAAVIPVFVSAALAGEIIPIFGDGLQTRDFTSVQSVCTVIADALHRQTASRTAVNLAFGGRLSLFDVIAELESILGRSLAIEFRPPRLGDVRDSQADQTLLRTLFPDARPVSFRAALEETVAWLRKDLTVPRT